MKNPDNIEELSRLPIDLMGLIFYPKSPRYIGNLEPDALKVLPENIERVGVFVNEEVDKIQEAISKYNLDYVQLHGNESPEYVRNLKQLAPDIKIIKAFSISDASDFDITQEYENLADCFLFDTKTPHYGGSGQKFDWLILNEYKGNTPFFLSGGISLQDTVLIRKLEYNRIIGLDLNSKFEIEPGLKNIELLHRFIKEIKS
ncbi:MAG: phosphoribosylanthranilate isomerase [Dysgonomonas sp.]|nr:phosphoribosylanthranilate isomerase [Dysgonomonas sp.]